MMLVGDDFDAEQGFADRRTGIRDRGGPGRKDALKRGPDTTDGVRRD
jgi:hypothetical protein